VRSADNLTTFMYRMNEICEPQPTGILRARPGLYRDCLTFTSRSKCLVATADCRGAEGGAIQVFTQKNP